MPLMPRVGVVRHINSDQIVAVQRIATAMKGAWQDLAPTFDRIE
jgi:hypothetical protein